MTGKTRGFGFVMYEDQRSTVMAVDNMNGASVLSRTIRVRETCLFPCLLIAKLFVARWTIVGSTTSLEQRMKMESMSNPMPLPITLCRQL